MARLPTTYPDSDYLEDAEMAFEDAPRRGFLKFVWLCVFAACLIGAWIYGYKLGFNGPNSGIQAVDNGNGKVFPIEFSGEVLVVPEEYLRRIVRDSDTTVQKVELALFWPRPSLSFLGSAGQEPTGAVKLRDGLFISIERRGQSIGPAKRLSDVFIHYFSGPPIAGPGGLKQQSLRSGTVYDGQELLIAGAPDENTYYLCFIEDTSLTPSMCRGERIALEEFTVMYRFHRAHLANWRAVETRVTELVKELVNVKD